MTASDPPTTFSLPPGENPLGIRHPFVAAAPLGQSMLQPKFLTPLGARSLSVLNPSTFSAGFQATEPEWQFPFEDAFFDAPEIPPGSLNKGGEEVGDSGEGSVVQRSPEIPPAPLNKGAEVENEVLLMKGNLGRSATVPLNNSKTPTEVPLTKGDLGRSLPSHPISQSQPLASTIQPSRENSDGGEQPDSISEPDGVEADPSSQLLLSALENDPNNEEDSQSDLIAPIESFSQPSNDSPIQRSPASFASASTIDIPFDITGNPPIQRSSERIPADITSEVQRLPESSPADITSEVQRLPESSPADITSEVQRSLESLPADITSEVQRSLESLPADITSEVQRSPEISATGNTINVQSDGGDTLSTQRSLESPLSDYSASSTSELPLQRSLESPLSIDLVDFQTETEFSEPITQPETTTQLENANSFQPTESAESSPQLSTQQKAQQSVPLEVTPVDVNQTDELTSVIASEAINSSTTQPVIQRQEKQPGSDNTVSRERAERIIQPEPTPTPTIPVIQKVEERQTDSRTSSELTQDAAGSQTIEMAFPEFTQTVEEYQTNPIAQPELIQRVEENQVDSIAALELVQSIDQSGIQAISEQAIPAQPIAQRTLEQHTLEQSTLEQSTSEDEIASPSPPSVQPKLYVQSEAVAPDGAGDLTEPKPVPIIEPKFEHPVEFGHPAITPAAQVSIQPKWEQQGETDAASSARTDQGFDPSELSQRDRNQPSTDFFSEAPAITADPSLTPDPTPLTEAIAANSTPTVNLSPETATIADYPSTAEPLLTPETIPTEAALPTDTAHPSQTTEPLSTIEAIAHNPDVLTEPLPEPAAIAANLFQSPDPFPVESPSAESLFPESSFPESSSAENLSPESSSLEIPVAENPSPISDSAVEPTALPELPTVLQRISVLEPLAQLQPLTDMPGSESSTSTPLLSPSPTPAISPTVIQTQLDDQPIARKEQPGSAAASQALASTAVPAEWSNIEKLFQSMPSSSSEGSSAASSTASLSGEPIGEWSSIAELFQASSSSAATPDLQQAQRSPIESIPIEPVSEGYPDLEVYANGSVATPVIRRTPLPASEMALPDVQTFTDEGTDQQDEESRSSASPEQLEQLAYEIYLRVRQRFALERERSGPFYSKRL